MDDLFTDLPMLKITQTAIAWTSIKKQSTPEYILLHLYGVTYAAELPTSFILKIRRKFWY